MEAWRGMGDSLGWRPPLSTNVSAVWHCGIGAVQRAKGRSPDAIGELRPYERSRCAEHWGMCIPWCTRPTEGSHVLTTDDATLQGRNAKAALFPGLLPIFPSAAFAGSIKAGAP